MYCACCFAFDILLPASLLQYYLCIVLWVHLAQTLKAASKLPWKVVKGSFRKVLKMFFISNRERGVKENPMLDIKYWIKLGLYFEGLSLICWSQIGDARKKQIGIAGFFFLRASLAHWQLLYSTDFFYSTGQFFILRAYRRLWFGAVLQQVKNLYQLGSWFSGLTIFTFYLLHILATYLFHTLLCSTCQSLLYKGVIINEYIAESAKSKSILVQVQCWVL